MRGGHPAVRRRPATNVQDAVAQYSFFTELRYELTYTVQYTVYYKLFTNSAEYFTKSPMLYYENQHFQELLVSLVKALFHEILSYKFFDISLPSSPEYVNFVRSNLFLNSQRYS